MLDMIERLLLEADLEDQLPKLEVIVPLLSASGVTGKDMFSTSTNNFANFDLFFKNTKMQVYGKTIDGIKDLLRFLLSEPSTGRALKRQVAFLFDFEEIEHTTVLGLTLQVRFANFLQIDHQTVLGFKLPKIQFFTFTFQLLPLSRIFQHIF